MGLHLQQLLQKLCLNTDWNSAVFWKLKHRARMVLTWEDAYYNNDGKHDSQENRCFGEGSESLQDGHFPHDLLGLAVAKMSSHVYSLGEGIVGQVAVTGKHKWIFADGDGLVGWSSVEHCDGWQAQFLAGVQTIVVAAVVPHGVVQLVSLNKIDENIKLVNHIRDVFSAFQDPSIGCVSSPMQCGTQNSSHLWDASMGSELHPFVTETDYVQRKECLSMSSVVALPKQPDGSYHPNLHDRPSMAFVSRKNLCLGSSIVDDRIPYMKQELREQLSSSSQGKKGCSENAGADFGNKTISSLSHLTGNWTSCDTPIVTEKAGVKRKNCQLDQLDPVACENAILNYEVDLAQGPLDVPVTGSEILSAVGKDAKQSEISCLQNLNSSGKLSAGLELHEALGQAFLKQNYPWWWEMERSEARTESEMPEETDGSLLTTESGCDHLLEAVVANFCQKENSIKCKKSFSASTESMLTIEKVPEPSSATNHTTSSACNYVGCSSLLEESTQTGFNSSGSCGIWSSKAFSSSSPSMHKEQLSRPAEVAKSNKKRARPGENSRPRPRDRQLIQDRIKELRELVPNGAKCSIDSLLERTIKHMLYLQGVTKHADKLNSCVKSRACNKEKGVLGGVSYDQGSSWAVEVGGQMKVCPIIVENLNMNGELLIEMLCEDCDHFLEVCESIKGLGLTILKGVTDGHGDKTWMRFVVEGQNNRSMHRMDVLWSLVQILQSKATTA